jgi:RNA polymerase sigma-70 factor (ECF subfamily)
MSTPSRNTSLGEDDVAALLLAVAEGDERAFTALYRVGSPRVHAIVRRIVVDEQLSVEVSQEVFLSLWLETAARYDPAKGSGISWLLTLAHRKAVDKVRLEQTHRARTFAYGTRNIDVDFDCVSETVLARWEAVQVREGLATLSEAQRVAICLAYYGAMTYREVAEHLGIPVPTAKTRIRDGIRKLGLCLAQGDEPARAVDGVPERAVRA